MEPVTMALILGGLNAGMAAIKAKQAARQRQQEANVRAAEIEASPWTNKGPSTQVATSAPNAWAEMGGGLINAAGQTAALSQAGLFKAADTASAAKAAADTAVKAATTAVPQSLPPPPEGLGPLNPAMQTAEGGAPTLFGRTATASPWTVMPESAEAAKLAREKALFNLGSYKF